MLDFVQTEIYLFDKATLLFLLVNKPARENLGYSSDELSCMTPLDLMRDFTPERLTNLSKNLDNGEEEVIEYSTFHYRKDGSCYPVEVKLSEWTFRGAPAYMAAALSATDRSITEERLKNTLEDLAKLNRYETVINIVTQAVHKTIDLQMVMENAVEALSRNMDAVNNICIYLREGGEAVMQAHRGYPDWFVERVKRIPFPKGFTWKTLIDGRMIYVPDTERDNVIGQAGKELGTRSYLSIPIKSHEENVGVININADVKYAFGPNELRVLEIVSRQIEIAINNARYAESLVLSERALQEKVSLLSKKERYEKIINTVSQSVHSSINLDEVMVNAVNALAENIDDVEMVSIFMIEGEDLVLKAEHGFPEWFRERVTRVRRPRGLMWKTVIERKTVYIPDTEYETALGPAGKEAGVKSYAGMPIGLGEETIGCINVSSLKKNVFSEDELNLLEIIREQIETAILNAKHVEALKTSEERYQTLTDILPIGIFRADKEGVGVYVNNKLCEITGITKEDAFGEGWKEKVHPEDRKRVVDIWTASVKARIPAKEEYRFVHPGGKTVWVFAEGIPDTGADGEFKGYVGTLTDITERKLSEEKIRFQASLLDQVRNAVIATDLDGKILYWNKFAEKIYQWREYEVAGRNIIDTVVPESSRGKAKQIIDTVNESGHWEGDVFPKRKDGSTFPAQLILSVIRDERGRVIGNVAVVTDITEKKMLETRFLRAQRLESIGTLAGGIAHDLNNILQPIMLSIQILKQGISGEKYERILSVVESSAERGADLIRQVLSFARGVESEKQTLNVKYLISDVLKIMKETFPKSIEIKTYTDGELRNIVGDYTQLHQVILNICVNARDAMQAGGELSISTRNISAGEDGSGKYIDIVPGEYVEITISDTGSGIPPEVMDKIFDPFFTTKEQDKGTGLGLSTAYGIIKEHGGHIYAESETGRGSRFVIYLPAIPVKAQQESDAYEDTDAAAGTGETVLVVDDEPAVLDITRAILEEFGYKVLTANNGHEALDVISDRKKGIDAAIVDMMMPVIGGKTVIRSLKKMRPALKIICASGYQKEHELITMEENTADAFLSKPYNSETLLRTLDEVLHGEEG
ncbi:MAG: PAS domain S-box protein [Thermodesulfobacteriota bacterium]